jgi:alpha-L-fucosidase 2
MNRIRISLLIALLGCLCASAETRTNIEYANVAGVSLRLDAGVPDGSGPFPIAIVVHGGGWSSGDKQKDIDVLFEPLSRAKVAWFSINYRLAPTNPWPAGFEDVQTAIRWVKANAAEFKGDPKRVALLGYSAGGHLVCQAAVQARQDTQVQAVVGFAAPTDLVSDTARRGGLSKSLQALLGRPEKITPETQKVLHQLSPLDFIKPGLPPFLLIHGTEDKSVPYDQSVRFQARLKENSVPCDLITLKGAPHRISEWSTFQPGYGDQMAQWLSRTLGNGAPAKR